LLATLADLHDELATRQPGDSPVGGQDDVRSEDVARRSHEGVRKPDRRLSGTECGRACGDLLVQRHDHEAETAQDRPDVAGDAAASRRDQRLGERRRGEQELVLRVAACCADLGGAR
jgi:hypothetical protein